MTNCKTKYEIVKLRELFTKDEKFGLNSEEFDAGMGKLDSYAAKKLMVLVPVAVVFSCLVLIFGVLFIPSVIYIFQKAVISVEQQGKGLLEANVLANTAIPPAVKGTIPGRSTDPLKGSAPETELFSDVSTNSPDYEALVYLKKQGLISGYDDGTYRPEQLLTRAEMVKIVAVAKRQFPLALNYNGCFSDMKDEWFVPDVCLAKEKGWIDGYADGTFHPGEEVSKVEALKVLIRAFDVNSPSNSLVNCYQDVPADAWYREVADTAFARGIVDEKPGIDLLKPESPIDRGTFAKMLYKVLEL